MDQRLIYLLFLLLLGLLIYLLLRLRRLEELIRGYKWKNQEGVGAWSRSRKPLLLLIALVQALYFLVDWLLLRDFQFHHILLALVSIGLPLYFYFTDDG